ncbi:MAG: hypothetical protein DRJ50_14880 [Actinobacteria bacterium]|nr:MAG: hypothetical protein DRJ50_14880 [Actinomycetota bacterium]
MSSPSDPGDSIATIRARRFDNSSGPSDPLRNDLEVGRTVTASGGFAVEESEFVGLPDTASGTTTGTDAENQSSNISK